MQPDPVPAPVPTATAPEVVDEAWDRLGTTGPEFDGWLSNHGPMAVEAMARHGHGDAVPAWLDRYARRLEPAPRPSGPITCWEEALGDPRRIGDWLAFFEHQTAERSWGEVLGTWWPRLLPGIAAGATHGVIRVGHAVRVIRESGATTPRVAELGRALAYWAARWQPVPGVSPPAGERSPSQALSELPRLSDRDGGIRERLAALDELPGWTGAVASLRASGDPEAVLRDVVIAAVTRYATHAHGNPVMLVHAATAPNAVLRVLPVLARELWPASVAAAWAATAAVHAAYDPGLAGPVATPPHSPPDAFDLAVGHGDEHVVKLADTALDVHRWTGDPTALAAVTRAAELIDPMA